MSLKITVTGDRRDPKSFILKPENESIWARESSSDAEYKLIQLPDEEGMLGRTWSVILNTEQQSILCYVDECGYAIQESIRTLPLRPGTIVLDDPEVGGCNSFYVPTVKSFRTPAFQEFLDKYGIYGMIRSKPSDVLIFDAHLRDENVYTTYVHSDGEVVHDIDDLETWSCDGSWSLERRARFDESGHLVCDGYVLRTRLRSIRALEKSFAEHGILPVR